MTYLDWAATAPPDPEIMRLMADAAVEYSGNPSSPYPLGKKAKTVLEEARNRCAAVLGCASGSLTFTSGGTESNAIVLLSRLLRREPGTILISSLEHPSVTETAKMLDAQGWSMKEIPPESDGRISSSRLRSLLEKNPETRLVCVMGVNNETGAVMPLDELAAAIRDFEAEKGGRPIHFHGDLVQAIGKIPVDLSSLDLDTASFSAHKFRGPRGIGLLYHRNPQFEVLIRGGGQEHGIRPGTENVAGALAMTEALEKYGRPNEKVSELGGWLLEELMKIDGCKVIPEARRGLSPKNFYAPGIIALSVPPIPGEVLARVLAEEGFAISTGSACSSNKKGKLPKSMTAMGVSGDVAAGMIRVSIGALTMKEDLERFITAVNRQIKILRTALRRE